MLDRVGALRAERQAVIDLCRQLTEDQWSTASRCEGWSIKDVLAHMAAACHGTFTPWVVKMMRSSNLERSNDADVAERQARPAADVFAEYEVWSRRFTGVQPLLQRRPLSSIPIRLGDLGSYPARLLTSAIVFDSHVHLRHDIATALDAAVPPSDANRAAVALEWMMAGMATMSGDALSWMDRSVEIRLKGDGGGTWGVLGTDSGGPRVVAGSAPSPAVTVEGSTEGFPIWATARQPWRASDVSLQGDEEYGTRFLDSVRVV
jgi:uncharacterized protein (TIGR03083 family)